MRSSMVKRRSKLPVGSAPVHEALEKLDPIDNLDP